MVTVSFSNALLGRNTGTSSRFTGIAVIFGAFSFAIGWLLNVLGLPDGFELVAYGITGSAFVIAAIHTYENSGLLVSWMLLFWPTAGAVAYMGYAAAVDGAQGWQYLLSDVVFAGVYGGPSPRFSAVR